MRNPWLDIPLADYEAHMALPSVGQGRMLGETLESLVMQYAPRAVAILGCAGGNGFERLAPMLGPSGPESTRAVPRRLNRVVGVDLNPHYVAAARERFGAELRGVELYVADIESAETLFAPVDFVYAGLVFEYLETRRGLSFVQRHLVPGEIFAAVVQRRDAHLARVSPSPYAYRSLQRLETLSRWVEPEGLRDEAESAGFMLEQSAELVAGGGKRFALEVFRSRRT